MVKTWKKADIVVVTTRISLVLAILAKTLGKKIVFLDAMCEEVPKQPWRRMAIKQALRLSSACICLSPNQAHHWAKQLNVPDDKFTPIHYGIDTEFYKCPTNDSNTQDTKPYILAVGRDPRRDFDTLISAANEIGWELKLVTQPYLISKSASDNPKIQILDGLSYDELFQLYTNAKIVVVPIKQNTTYMSGIRATMEAMLLGCPVIASRVSGMEDYFDDRKEILYVEPENSNEKTSSNTNSDPHSNLPSHFINSARNEFHIKLMQSSALVKLMILLSLNVWTSSRIKLKFIG